MFELVRQITNFESHSVKVEHSILSGEKSRGNRDEYKRPLLSRAAAVATIDPFTVEETKDMIEFRLAVAGRKNPLFEEDAIDEIFTLTKGIPREIVKTCMDTMTIASLNNLTSIPKEAVQRARTE